MEMSLKFIIIKHHPRHARFGVVEEEGHNELTRYIHDEVCAEWYDCDTDCTTSNDGVRVDSHVSQGLEHVDGDESPMVGKIRFLICIILTEFCQQLRVLR